MEQCAPAVDALPPSGGSFFDEPVQGTVQPVDLLARQEPG